MKTLLKSCAKACARPGSAPPYVLLGHSVAGIYMLDWAARYPSEVTAVIGDDASLPAQFEDPALLSAVTGRQLWYFPLLNRMGLARLYGRLPLASSAKRLRSLAGGDPSRIPEARSLSARNTLSRTIVDETPPRGAQLPRRPAAAFSQRLPPAAFRRAGHC